MHRARRTRRARRGGMSRADEDRFLKEQKEHRLDSLKAEKHLGKAEIHEGVGKEIRKPSPLVGVVDLRTEGARQEAKAGRRRSRRRHTRRRR